MATAAGHNPATGYWGLQEVDRRCGDLRFQLMEASAPPEAVVAHGHRKPHAVFAFNGTYISAANDEREPLATAALVINPPDMWHRDRFARGSGYFLAIDLPADMPGTDCPRILRGDEVITACFAIIDRLRDSEVLALEEHGRAIVTGISGTQRCGSRIAQAYAAIMDSHAPEELTLADLAQLAECHVNYVSSAFRQRYGVSAARLLRLRRIERACTLLRDERQTLSAIAHQLGFTDQAHFTRVFTREMGQPPGQWRGSIA
ncbi:helix-turn-helix domain-containing protein [Aurantiacibacter sp. MUD61]|uniref:helix-turn-helix domain-containing protein n=1 Tax=Aurantiacibacter sp. MUD61 TaxID=3009083 RepID=UPI0022F0F416|nr:AraC family transcriptional regulator [Aurantiacibacter sp. MUD61]